MENRMKKKDMLLAGSVCVLAAVIWIAVHVFMPKENHKIRITVDGEVFGEYSLDENREIAIGDTNVCRIQDGKVQMTEADCPDQLCIHQRAVDAGGGSVICLPNKVVIEAISDSGDTGSSEEIDTVV